MKKYIVLLLIALLPVILGICGVHHLGGSRVPETTLVLLAAGMVNIPVNALIGGITALILRRRRAVWWAMMVCFFYSYFGFGILYGSFASEGGFGIHTLNSSVLLAVVGYIGCLFTYGMFNVIRGQLQRINNPEAFAAPKGPAKKKKR